MQHNQNKIISLLAVGVALAISSAASAAPAAAATTVTKTSTTGQNVSLSWTEYDPDNLLGLPGNVHIGYFYADQGPYGSYAFGNVTDFDCEEGESPYGGGHGVVGGLVKDVVDSGQDTVASATKGALQDIADSSASTIDPAIVVEAVKVELNKEVTGVIADKFKPVPTCDFIQNRGLEGGGTIELNTSGGSVHITGFVTVTSGGHGEPGTVLATPPIDVTITGGEWQDYEYSYSARGKSYGYSNWQKGTYWNGGTVTGGIGPMGFADDADDESYGYFSSYSYRTVDRVR